MDSHNTMRMIDRIIIIAAFIAIFAVIKGSQRDAQQISARIEKQQRESPSD